MRARQVLLTIAALLCVRAAGAEQLVSIYPLQSEGLDRATRQQVETLLRIAAARVPGSTVQTRGKTQRAIHRASDRSDDCSRRLPCLVQVGEVSGATVLLLASAERTPSSYLVTAQLIDVDKERVSRRVQGELAGAAAEISEGMHNLVAQLLAPDEYLGTLDVRSLMPGARVIVDGLQVGTTPCEPISVRPGLRELQVQLSGAADLQQMVRIRNASTTVVNISVDGDRVSAEVDEASAASTSPPPPAAVALAQRLASSAPPSAAVPAPAPTAAAAPSTPPPPVTAAPPAEESAPSTLLTASIALAAAGAATTIIGGGALAAWGVAYSQLSAAMDDDNVGVVDPTSYNEWDQQRGLYEALGVAGGITLPLGFAALAGGLGLALWSLTDTSAAPLPSDED